MNQPELNAFALQLFHAALQGAAASKLLVRKPIAEFVSRRLQDYAAIRLLAIGKSAIALAGAAEQQLEQHKLAEGLAIVPHGYAQQPLPAYEVRPSARIEIMEAAHPIPDEAGVRAAERALRMAETTGEDDLLLVLISGGGTALLPAFAGAITLDCARTTFKLLLNSGAAIHELNTVRKHISRISGGRLAAAAYGEVLALVVSDVPGDQLSVIASGPTVPDPSTFAEACGILQRRGIWDALPAAVRQHISKGIADPTLESPKPGDPRLMHARTELLGGNIEALRAARAEAERLGARARLSGEQVEGDALRWGTYMGHLASDPRVQKPEAGAAPADVDILLLGGETTLKITGNGHGGRNQELALAAALKLDGAPHAAVVLSAGSDGVDGISPAGAPSAAGALVTPATIRQARSLGIDPAVYQANNDSYGFFAALGAADAEGPEQGGHVVCGPTHCNVMDLMFVLTSETHTP